MEIQPFLEHTSLVFWSMRCFKSASRSSRLIDEIIVFLQSKIPLICGLAGSVPRDRYGDLSLEQVLICIY
jgi:hypothetical protein